MQFVPDDDQGPELDVPYYGETKSEDGWQGHSTSRSYDTLKSDVTKALARLGGIVHGIQRGSYRIGDFERAGAQINYSIEGPDGNMAYGRLDVAALPVQEPYGGNKSHSGYSRTLENLQMRSLAMALYNVVEALKAQWVLKQLNPAYVPLMPWLLGKDDLTLSEAYAEAGFSKALMPPNAGDFVEGDFREK